jgi:hypothetical protein
MPNGPSSPRSTIETESRKETIMSTTEKRILVTAKLKTKHYVLLLSRAWAIYNAWLANAASLPTPAPTLAVFLVLLQAYDTAQNQASTRDKLVIQTRNAKALLVISAIGAWEAQIQGACDANPAEAGQLIASGGMFVRGTGKHNKPVLALVLVAGQLGTVGANANATLLTGGSHKRPTFNWQSSGDGGKTITNGSSTPHANTTFENVALLSTLSVRVSVTLGKTTGDWSQWVSVLVH